MILYYSCAQEVRAKQLKALMPEFSLQEVGVADTRDTHSIDQVDTRLMAVNSAAKLGPCLYLAEEGLLIYTAEFKPLNLNTFYQQFIARRRPGIARELLVQAVKLKAGATLNVLDLTAGIGRDAILLALAGYAVTLVENNPYLALILNYLCLEFAAQLPNMTVVYADHNAYLQDKRQKYAVIYLDPMFAEAKRALAKKDMQLIALFLQQANVSKTTDFAQLFRQAAACCTHKIVIKRDNKQARLITTPLPSHSKTGTTVRFDVYLIIP